MYAADSGTTSYAPDMVNVVYPLIIEGKAVTEGGGYPYGLQVNVSVRENKVSGLYNLNSQKYEASSYDLETNMQTIVNIATSQNQYGYMENYPNLKTTEIKLGTPTQILMHYYRTNEKGIGEELYIPAMSFPVEENSQYMQSITVPLVKEFINENQQGTIVPMGKPMMAPESLK